MQFALSRYAFHLPKDVSVMLRSLFQFFNWHKVDYQISASLQNVTKAFNESFDYVCNIPSWW